MREEYLILSVLLGVLTVASLVTLILRRRAGPQPNAVLDNLSARMKAWWVMIVLLGAVFLAAVLYLKDGIAGWVAKGWRELERRLDGPKRATSPAVPVAPNLFERSKLPRSGKCLEVSDISKRFKGVLALDCVGRGIV